MKEMDKELLESFIEQYHNWTADYKLSRHLSSELAFYLEQKKQRLQHKQLKIEENYEHVNEEITGSIRRSEKPYEARIFYREARHLLSYLHNGKILKTIKEPVVFYATFLNKEGYQDEVHTCPNCGHQFKVSEIINGCPYCGTFFENLEYYPYVTSFYSVPGIVERSTLKEKLLKIVLTPAIIIGIILLVTSFLSYDEYVWPIRIFISFFTAFFGGAMSAFVVYILCSMGMLAKLFYEAFRSLKLLGGLSASRKLNKLMKDLDRDFSYEYFEGRLITLFRSIAFADQRKDLSIYTGDEDLSFLDDIVDLSYRGSSALKDFQIKDDIITITMKVFMQVIWYTDKIDRKDEDYTIVLKKKVSTRDLSFKINKVQCHSCGASFDALHQKNCPHCNTPYELYHDEWVIESISLN